MAFDLVSNSFTKEEWLDDVEIPRKTEEDDEKKTDTALNVDIKGEASDIQQISKKGEAKLEKVEPKDEPLCYSVKLDYGSAALEESTVDPLGEEPYFCHVCDFVANTGDALLCHVKMHEDQVGDPGSGHVGDSTSRQKKTRKVRKTLACEHCDFTSTVLRYLKNHKKIHLTSFACNGCDFKTTCKKTLASHAKIHVPKELFACGICKHTTRNRLSLEKHMENHAKRLCPNKAEESPADPRFVGFKCRQCDHVATSITRLKKHMDSHRADALGGADVSIPSELECDQCDFKAKSERFLKIHYSRIHNIKCQYCRVACTDRTALSKHMVDFHKAEPFYFVDDLKMSQSDSKSTKRARYCDLCGYVSRAQNQVNNHMKKIHGIIQPRSITCPYCRVACTDRRALSKHMVDSHKAEPSYLVDLKRSLRSDSKSTKSAVYCDLCGYVARGQHYVDKHMKKIHGIMQPRKRPQMNPPLMLTGNGLLD